MGTPFFGKLRIAQIVAVLSLSLSTLPGFSQTYTVDGATTLNTIGTLIQGKTSGTIRIRFKGYLNVGQLSITALSADSLIFERSEESAEPVEFTGTLFQFRNVTSQVVFRNLAFKSKNGSAIFMDGLSAPGPNKNLLLDSCIVFGDTLNPSFFSWLGGSDSKVNFKRSIFSSLGTLNTRFDITADTVALVNCYLNFGGIVSATTSKILSLENNTSNRTQYSFNGSFTGTYAFRNNFYAHPPGKNRLPGTTNKFVMQMLGYSGGTAFGNIRFPAWYFIDYPSNSAHSDASNSILPEAFGDTSSLWSFPIPGDAVHGYLNPPEAGVPKFNAFPGDTILGFRLSPKDSVGITFAPATIPRTLYGSLGTSVYPTATDSTRTLWVRDTTLQLAGPVSVGSVSFHTGKSQGLPILFYQAGGSYLPGPLGQDGSLNFTNTVSASRSFIPSFAGQNTFKGTKVAVRGLGTDTAFVFSTVSRAGRTFFAATTLTSSNKRWRILEKGGKPFGFRDTTNAEGIGDVRFGFAKNGSDEPFLSDSTYWWTGGTAFLSKTDSAGKYWGKAGFASAFQGILIERLTIGATNDTLLLSQGKVVAHSAKGYQLQVDSSFHPAQAQYPDMGSFSSGVSLTSHGRKSGDSLFLELRKADPLQKAFMRQGEKAVALTPIKEDSLSVLLSLALGDSVQTTFLARKYSIPAGVKTELYFGLDTATGILSSKPGELHIDSAVSLTGLNIVNKRVLAGRKIKMDSLQLQNPFTLSFAVKTPIRKDSTAAFSFDGSAWKPITGIGNGDRLAFPVAQDLQAIVVVEGLPPEDLIPKQPAMAAEKVISDNSLMITPRLTPDEKANIQSYRVDLFSVDLAGKITLESSPLIAPDSVASVSLSNGRSYLYRVIYKSFADRYSQDTAWIAIPERQISGTELQETVPKRKAKFKYLVGVPFDGSFQANIQAGFEGGKMPEQVSFSGISDGRWTSLLGSGNPKLGRGGGYLLAATSPFQVQVGTAKLPELKADTIRFKEAGWHLFSSPFAFPISEANMKLDSSAVSNAWALKHSDTTVGSAATSPWEIATSFMPFEGYLIYAFKATELVFDPFLRGANALPKSSGNGTRSKELRLTLLSGQEASTMSFYSGGGLRKTPYMKAPDAGTELKAGGDGGWLLKDEPRLDSMESEVDIIAKAAGTVSLELEAANIGILDAALINLQSGRIYGKEEFRSIQLQEGENSFSLLHGNAVSVGISKFLSDLHTSFSLDQNYPNPFQGQTQIRFRIPGNMGTIREAGLEVMDLSGKVVQSLPMGALALGTHVIAVGKKEWKPGVYIYRLTLKTDQRVVSLKKKMIRGTGAQ